MKTSYLFLVFCLFIFDLSSIEVEGHLTEDTTWHPMNNPYEVVDNVFVDEEVTLTILPGVEVVIQSAQLTCLEDFNDYFWYQYGNNTAKMIWVNGNIIAEGTVEDSILFTHDQDDFNYYWGCIYVTESSEMPIFKHCILEYSGGTGIAVGNIADGAITIYNGTGLINHCTIRNNRQALLASHDYIRDFEVTYCAFYNDNVNYYVQTAWGNVHLSLSPQDDNYHSALLANNYFSGRYLNINSAYYVSNTNIGCNNVSVGTLEGKVSYIYNNDFTSCPTGIYGGNLGDSIFIKNNRFINGNDGLDLDEAYVDISDNHFEGCGIKGPSQVELIGKIKNNVISNTNLSISGRYEEISNNIFYNCDKVSSVIGSSNTFQNNLLINNVELCNLLANNPIFENNIFISNGMEDVEILNNPIFRNCIIDFPLDPPLINGGGNIIIDSLQAQSIFEDIQSGDFHLAPGSIAIDAGFDTLGYYYPFDLDYNHRVWDGDNNGSAVIDIGPYEFGSLSLGGIEGLTFDPVTGDFVDYVLIKINNEPGEFSFSDSVGSYEYKLPAGIYDVYAERVFYDVVVEYQIEVIEGEFTQLDIPMIKTVDVQNNEIIPVADNFQLNNFPNPFNPSTNISFSIQNNSKVELSIFNIKGQKITTLINEHLSKGKHSIIWSGFDQNGNQVCSGIYFYKLKVGNQESVKRMLLLK